MMRVLLHLSDSVYSVYHMLYLSYVCFSDNDWVEHTLHTVYSHDIHIVLLTLWFCSHPVCLCVCVCVSVWMCSVRKLCWPCFLERRVSVCCPETSPRVCGPSCPPRRAQAVLVWQHLGLPPCLSDKDTLTGQYFL